MAGTLRAGRVTGCIVASLLVIGGIAWYCLKGDNHEAAKGTVSSEAQANLKSVLNSQEPSQPLKAVNTAPAAPAAPAAAEPAAKPAARKAPAPAQHAEKQPQKQAAHKPQEAAHPQAAAHPAAKHENHAAAASKELPKAAHKDEVSDEEAFAAMTRKKAGDKGDSFDHITKKQ